MTQVRLVIQTEACLEYAVLWIDADNDLIIPPMHGRPFQGDKIEFRDRMIYVDDITHTQAGMIINAHLNAGSYKLAMGVVDELIELGATTTK